MKNRDLYFRDPTTLELLNNGVSKVSERLSPGICEPPAIRAAGG